MKAVEFKEVNVLIAKDQSQFDVIPAKWDSKEGSMTFVFELSEEERKQVFETGFIYVKQITNGNPFHPIASTLLKEDILPDE